ncbi:PucR family transcriptional regulator [Nocardia gipuzkoensis]
MTEDIRRIVDDLAEELARSIVVVTPEIRVVTHSTHFGDEDAVRVQGILQRQADPAAVAYINAQHVSRWRESNFIPENRSIGMKRRSCTPIRWRGHLLGYLMMIDETRTLAAGDLERAERAAADIAVILSDNAQSEARRQQARETWLADLLFGDPGTARQAAENPPDGVHVDTQRPVQVLVVDAVAPGATSGRRRDELVRAALAGVAMVSETGPSVYLTSDGHGVMVLTATRHAPDRAKHVAERVIKTLNSSSEIARTVVGLASGDGVAGANIAYQRAKTASRGARALENQGDIVDWGNLGVYGVLLDMEPEVLDRLIAGGLHALKANDPTGVLLHTAEVYLDSAASPPAAALALHIHRTTLYYRLGRIQKLSGLDLGNGDDRLTLHLSLRALRVLEGLSSQTAR